jgi:hypothetical protein
MGNLRERLVLVIALLPFLIVGLFISPPAWLASIYHSTFMSRFISAEGGFLIDIPRRWEISGLSSPKRPNTLYKTGTLPGIFLDAWWFQRGERFLPSYYARVSVYKTTTSSGKRTSLEDLAKKLTPKLLHGRWTSLNFEVQRLKAYLWGKATISSDDDTLVCWLMVDDRSNLYVVAFHTNRFHAYKTVFEKMMRSFSLRVPS